ncbi:hypothetical protein GCM10017687_82210 [Streptomyces echinatus]
MREYLDGLPGRCRLSGRQKLPQFQIPATHGNLLSVAAPSSPGSPLVTPYIRHARSRVSLPAESG